MDWTNDRVSLFSQQAAKWSLVKHLKCCSWVPYRCSEISLENLWGLWLFNRISFGFTFKWNHDCKVFHMQKPHAFLLALRVLTISSSYKAIYFLLFMVQRRTFPCLWPHCHFSRSFCVDYMPPRPSTLGAERTSVISKKEAGWFGRRQVMCYLKRYYTLYSFKCIFSVILMFCRVQRGF